MDDQPTEDNEQSVFSNLSSQDIKLLVITFAGTLAANIVTVIFVGLALGTARHLDFASRPWLPLIIFPLAAIGFLAVTVLDYVIYSRQRKSGRRPFYGFWVMKKIMKFLAIALIGFAIYIVLDFVGLLAGIK